MNEQEQKPKNRKLLTYYLILGACILVIAAVAIAVTLSLTLGGSSDLADDDNVTVDADADADEDEDSDGEADADADGGDDDGEEGEATAAETTLLMPVTTVSAINTYGFYYNSTLDKYYVHTGIDFAGEVGDEVYAALDGTVTSIVLNSYLTGTTITLSHDNGLETVYTFVDVADGLSVGDAVSRGDVIATIAEATGKEYKDGAHLHFEVYLNGSAVDPEAYLDIDEK